MSKSIQENYFKDNANMSSDDIINDIESDNNSSEQKMHIIYIAIRKFGNDDNPSSLSPKQTAILFQRIKALCNQSMFFENYTIYRYNPSNSKYEKLSIPDNPILSLFFGIQFTKDYQSDFNTFAITIQKLSSIIYQTITNTFDISIDMDNETFIKADDVDNKVSFSHLSIYELSKLYSILTDNEEENIKPQKTTKESSIKFHFNGPVTFDNSLSEKQLSDTEPGDILYSTSNGHLVLDSTTLDERNTPIAIAVEGYDTETYSVRFMALNYLAWYNPSTGSKNPCAFVFGNKGNEVKFTTDDVKRGYTHNYFYDYMNDNPVKRLSHSSYVINTPEAYHFPVFETVYFYHTLGTTRGDWYIPVYYEFRYYIKGNLYKINHSRRSLGLKPLAELNYYTCIEFNDECCNVLDLKDFILDAYWEKDKSENTCAIALLNVTEE